MKKKCLKFCCVFTSLKNLLSVAAGKISASNVIPLQVKQNSVNKGTILNSYTKTVLFKQNNNQERIK